MKLVIEISEKTYAEITAKDATTKAEAIICNGIPLEQMLDEAYENFGELKAGDSFIIINGKKHSTDTAYAMDGIELFIDFITGREPDGDEEDSLREVTREEFESFIKNYPRKLKSNWFMDWLEYYDFPSKDYKPEDLDDLYSYQVARHYCNVYGDDKYYIKEGGE